MKKKKLIKTLRRLRKYAADECDTKTALSLSPQVSKNVMIDAVCWANYYNGKAHAYEDMIYRIQNGEV